jgi:hypothetical protein
MQTAESPLRTVKDALSRVASTKPVRIGKMRSAGCVVR